MGFEIERSNIPNPDIRACGWCKFIDSRGIRKLAIKYDVEEYLSTVVENEKLIKKYCTCEYGEDFNNGYRPYDHDSDISYDTEDEVIDITSDIESTESEDEKLEIFDIDLDSHSDISYHSLDEEEN